MLFSQATKNKLNPALCNNHTEQKCPLEVQTCFSYQQALTVALIVWRYIVNMPFLSCPTPINNPHCLYLSPIVQVYDEHTFRPKVVIFSDLINLALWHVSRHKGGGGSTWSHLFITGGGINDHGVRYWSLKRNHENIHSIYNISNHDRRQHYRLNMVSVPR